WEWWPKPVFTPGKVNWLTEISEIAGGRNLYADVELASVQTDWEDVLNRQPDYICLAWVGVRREKVNPEIVLKRPGWSELEAVKQK
ncbi:cobalamin-binding protein, partial [Shouchella clausii]